MYTTAASPFILVNTQMRKESNVASQGNPNAFAKQNRETKNPKPSCHSTHSTRCLHCGAEQEVAVLFTGPALFCCIRAVGCCETRCPSTELCQGLQAVRFQLDLRDMALTPNAVAQILGDNLDLKPTIQCIGKVLSKLSCDEIPSKRCV